MSGPIKQSIASAISKIVSVCVDHAWLTLVCCVLITAIAGGHLIENLRINTDNEDMLSEELSFRQNSIAMDQAFPQLDDTLLIVVEAADADTADEGATALVDELAQKLDVFDYVFSSVSEPFFRQNGLLYLETGELNDLYDRLAGAQPFMGTLWQEPNLVGLASITNLIAEATDLNAANLSEAARVYDEMARVVEAIDDGQDAKIIWSELLFGRESDDGIERRLISVKPKLDYGSLQPAKRAKNTITAAAEKLDFADYGVRVRLTGSAIIQDDELRSVESGMGLAGIISVFVVTIVLWFGLRSLGMMCALLLTLVIGLFWTAAIAIFLVGEFNLISVAFAVLFVGLSVDFGIHFSLRATEYIGTQNQWSHALISGAKSVGPSLFFCAVTTSIAFFSFLPTSYVGLAELGLIAGVGMFVALITNLTVLPALLKLLVRKVPVHSIDADSGQPTANSRGPSFAILIGGVATVFLSAWIAKDVRFDFDPMNLRDHNAPSIMTLFDLADAGFVEPYSADLLLSDISELSKTRAQLEALSSVARVESIDDLLPLGVDEKLTIIDDLSLIIGTAFFVPQGKLDLTIVNQSSLLEDLRNSLSTLSEIEVLGPSANRLNNALEGITGLQVTAINKAMFGGLPAQLARLNELLGADEITLETLPRHLHDRFVSENGQVRLEIMPRDDLRSSEAIEKFALEVQSVAPDATGGPIIIVEAGEAVLDAFLQALLYSIVGIGLFLMITLRRGMDIIFVFAPVAVAGAWVLAVSTLFDLPFNFANVIVLPLLFGLSVDFGLHLVIRQRDQRSTANALKTTTPRAILLSAMTTLGSFGSIMLSGHPGTASMGMLLTIAIALTMIAILLILPALMTVLAPENIDNAA